MRLKLKKSFITVIAASCFAAIPVNAAVNQEMTDWFDSMGGFTNTTPPSEYKGQTQNGYSAGGFYQRSPVKNYQLMTATPPSLNVGCGGIDLTAGSFSFINKAALTAMFRNIGTSIGYSFLLAIQSSMPQMADLFKYLQDAANKVNQGQINSCQMTTGIPFVDGADLSENMSKVFSHIAGFKSNLFPDGHASQDGTKESVKGRADSQAAAIAQDPNKKELYQPGNVVWRALSKTSGLDNEDNLFIMSMVGTIVIDPPTSGTAGSPDRTASWRYIKPTSDTVDDFIGYKDGTTTTPIFLFSCGADLVECLTPTPSTTQVTPFIKLVATKIDRLRTQLLDRKQQNIADFSLVDAASIPAWKMISVSANYNPNFVDAYQRLIAVDIAYAYVAEKLKTATEVLANFANGPSAPPDARDAVEKLSARLNALEASLQIARIAEYDKVQSQAQLERQIQFMHQAMLQGIPAQAFNSMVVYGGM